MKHLIILALFACSLSAHAKNSQAKSIQNAPILSDKEQAEIISKKIYDYHRGEDPKNAKVLRVIYFHANDKEPCKNYKKRWEGILNDFKLFFDTEMKRNGYPQSKFQLELDKSRKPVLHMVQGEFNEGDKKYNYKAGRLIRKEIKTAMLKKGIDIDKETILIICHLNGSTTTYKSQYDCDESGQPILKDFPKKYQPRKRRRK